MPKLLLIAVGVIGLLGLYLVGAIWFVRRFPCPRRWSRIELFANLPRKVLETSILIDFLVISALPILLIKTWRKAKNYFGSNPKPG